MGLIERLAEQKIREAIARGELDDLPGQGKPLHLEGDDPFVPAELRMAYRILKNAGYVPPEVLLRQEIRSLRELLACIDDEGERERVSGKLRLLELRLAGMRPNAPPRLDDPLYRAKLNRHLRGRNG